jgi:hypothetical protein
LSGKAARHEGLYQLLLASYGGALGLLFVLRSTPAFNTPKVLRSACLEAWACAALGAAAAAWAWRALRRRFYEGRREFYPVLLCGQHLALALALRVPLGSPNWSTHTLWAAALWSLGSLLSLRWLRAATEEQAEQADQLALGLAPVLALAVLLWIHGLPDWPWLYSAGALACGAALSIAVERGPAVNGRRLWTALGALLLVAVLWPWKPGLDAQHQGFFLGPVQQVLHGNMMFANARCQYGIAPIYAMAACFRLSGLPPSYHGMTVLTALAYLPYLAVLWALGLRQLRSAALAAAGLALIVATNRFGYWGREWEPILYPSVGPWRFAPPLLILLAAAWRGRAPGRTRAAELAFAGLASIWSLEAALYGLPAYAVFLALEAWQGEDRASARIRRWARGLAWMAAAVALAHAALALLTYAAAGQWPHYGVYLGFFTAYGGELGFLQPDPRQPWFLLAFLPFAACAAAAIAVLRGERRRAFALAGALGALGVLQFSYFLFRAHPSNLRFIGVPSILAFFLLLDLAWAQAALPLVLRRTALFAAAALTALAVLLALPSVRQALPEQGWAPETEAGLGWGAFWRDLREPPVHSARAAAAAALAAEMLPGQRQVTMIFDPLDELEAHLRGDTVDPNGIGAAQQDILAPFTEPLDAGLGEGSVLIGAQDPATLTGLSEARDQLLRRRFSYSVLRCAPEGVCAYQLHALP